MVPILFRPSINFSFHNPVPFTLKPQLRQFSLFIPLRPGLKTAAPEHVTQSRPAHARGLSGLNHMGFRTKIFLLLAIEI